MIGEEIARQIGSQAFLLMGTKHRVVDNDSLTFDVKGSRSWNKIRVRLNAMDEYDVTFYKIGRAPNYKITEKTVSGVQCDQLHDVIESETGLYLSFRPRR